MGKTSRRLSLAEWKDEGLMYVARRRAATWNLGDWLLTGEELRYDIDFVSSMALTGHTKSYLYALRLTSSEWPQYERSYQIAWGTHRELARVKDLELRKEMFKKALKEHWNMHDVRDYLRAEGLSTVRIKEPKTTSRKYS